MARLTRDALERAQAISAQIAKEKAAEEDRRRKEAEVLAAAEMKSAREEQTRLLREQERKEGLRKDCIDCRQEFQIGEGEAAWFKAKGFEMPKRCHACRIVRREKKEREIDTAAEDYRMRTRWGLRGSSDTRQGAFDALDSEHPDLGSDPSIKPRQRRE